MVGAVLLEQNDEYKLQHRYMQIEGMAANVEPLDEGDWRMLTDERDRSERLW